jgi:DNA-directed RNA polymerase specialized sigma subunit
MNLLDHFSKEKLTQKVEARLSENDLALANMHEAVLYARACSGNDKLTDGELISVCWDALRKSAARFRPRRGTRFFAFCKPRIRGALVRHYNQMNVVRNGECEPVQVDDAGLPDDYSVEKDLPNVEPDFESIGFNERWAQVSGVLARTCTDRERTIMYLVYSLHFTFKEAGSVFGICRAAAQAIASRVIVRVKHTINPA